ncbi:unnamed protein product [Urochloa decumbens]|uniref:F-box domain-containing protein n=1 Tax=Urochloa decumbens TaxID=240449 RepID=A0ABC9FND2_9POAL
MASLGPQTMASNDAGVFLPRDALYEILLRVLARPLCRFRAVCKSWRSLLSDDPQFAAAHAARHPLFAVAVAGGSHGEAAEIDILDTSGHVVKRVSAGASALLRQMLPHLGLILTSHLVAVEGAYRALRVINLATGTVSLLPDDGGRFYSSFVFGRVASSTKGNDDAKYKVLSLSHHVTQVLTVDGNGTSQSHGAWRIVRTNPPVRIDKFHRETVVAKGVVYHLVDNNASDGWTMAAFDLAAEEWRPALVQGPVAEPSIGGNVWRNSLAEVNGRLAAVSSTVSTMDIWLLMGSGEQAMWRKRCRILTSSIQRPHGLFPDVEPLWALDDGRVALWVTSCRARVASGLWMYDPMTETCTEVAAMENFLKVGVGVYTGNLLQLPQRAHNK